MNFRKLTWILLALLAVASLSACVAADTPQPSPLAPTQPPAATEAPAYPPAVQPPAPNLYPTPGAYPGPGDTIFDPGTNDSQGPGERPPYVPAPGDEKLIRGNVFIDSAEILIMESFPPQFRLVIAGTLPTPCHQLRAEGLKPDEQNQFNIEVYSVTDPEMICTQVLKPFTESIALEVTEGGTYTVLVNGQKVGEFISP